MNNWKYKLARFMMGRYGGDQLSRTTTILALIMFVISTFLPTIPSGILYLASMGILIWSYYRVFSRNIAARTKENQIFMQKTWKIRNFFGPQMSKKISELKMLKTHHIYKCPSCGQKIRVPRGRGRIEIRCRKCMTTFIKKS